VLPHGSLTITLASSLVASRNCFDRQKSRNSPLTNPDDTDLQKPMRKFRQIGKTEKEDL
jgi:hypothetical protein